jgi:hypothetical protein
MSLNWNRKTPTRSEIAINRYLRPNRRRPAGERITDSKYNRVRRKCQLLYHVKWVASDWIPVTAVDDAPGNLLRHTMNNTFRNQVPRLVQRLGQPLAVAAPHW